MSETTLPTVVGGSFAVYFPDELATILADVASRTGRPYVGIQHLPGERWTVSPFATLLARVASAPGALVQQAPWEHDAALDPLLRDLAELLGGCQDAVGVRLDADPHACFERVFLLGDGKTFYEVQEKTHSLAHGFRVVEETAVPPGPQLHADLCALLSPQT